MFDLVKILVFQENIERRQNKLHIIVMLFIRYYLLFGHLATKLQLYSVFVGLSSLQQWLFTAIRPL